MPPKTNWTEVAILLGLVILVGFVHWLTRLMVRSKLQILDQKLNDVQGAIQDFRQAARLYREQGQTQDLQDAIDQLRRLGAVE